MLEVFAKERLVGKVELRADFLNVKPGGTEQKFRFEDYTQVNPFSGSLFTDLLQVLSRDAYMPSVLKNSTSHIAPNAML